MSFIAIRNHDFSGPTADLENKKGFGIILFYLVIFVWEAKKTFRIWIYALQLDCYFMSAGQVMMFSVLFALSFASRR